MSRLGSRQLQALASSLQFCMNCRRDMLSCLNTNPLRRFHSYQQHSRTKVSKWAGGRLSGLWRWRRSRAVTSSPSWTPRRCQTVAEKGQKNNRCSVVSGAPPQTSQVTLSTIFFLKRFVLHCRRPCRTNQAKNWIRGGAHERQNELSICCGWSLLDLIILYSPEVISAPPSATAKGVLRRSSASVRAIVFDLSLVHGLRGASSRSLIWFNANLILNVTELDPNAQQVIYAW